MNEYTDLGHTADVYLKASKNGKGLLVKHHIGTQRSQFSVSMNFALKKMSLLFFFFCAYNSSLDSGHAKSI